MPSLRTPKGSRFFCRKKQGAFCSPPLGRRLSGNVTDSSFLHLRPKVLSQVTILGGFQPYPSSKSKHLWERLEKSNVPIVLVDVYPVNDRWPSVVVDNERGVEKALSYLVSLGHTEIGYLSEPLYILPLVKRYQAFLGFMEKNKLQIRDQWVIVEKAQRNRVEIGFTLGNKLLEAKRRPTAILTSSDLVAVGALKAFLSSGINIPEDMSIVGFDDILLSSYLHPSLTTVRQPKYEMGRTATEILLRFIRGEKSDMSSSLVIVEPEVVERDSSCARKPN